MTVAAASLFDKPTQPVLGAASAWTQGVLGGSLATTLCVIAIAILGLLLLAGRLRVRRGVEVVLGCFLLLGAGLLAGQLQQLAGTAAGEGTGGEQVIVPTPTATPPPPPANY
ncbi:MAG: TrbC/VirB2 family protein, partial [Porphyrobacter sp.]|nr:TrbC/VirB2 family protein [Porphyrobacter sp.]